MRDSSKTTAFDRFSLPLWSIFLLLALLIYAPSMTGPYILDDSHTIQTNDAIQNPANLLKLWTSAKYYSSSPDNWGYRPVQAFLNAVCWQLGGGATWPFHLLKVIVFSLTAVFFTLIWRRLLPDAGGASVLWAGLFFLLNPVQTQVVSYISAMSTGLAGLFVALSLWFFLRFRAEGRLALLWLSGLCVFIGMLSKEEGIVVLGILPVMEFYLRWGEGRLRVRLADMKVFVPHLVAGGAALALIVSMFEPTSDLARGDMSRWLYFVTQWRAWIRYMLMYFVPYDLNADNLSFGFSPAGTEPLALLALAANLLIVAGAAVLAIFRKRLLPLFALTWFYGAIAPASSFIVLAEPVNDHRAFIAYLGWGGLTIPLFEALRNWTPRFAPAVVFGLLLGYAGWTTARNVTWSSNDLLWEDTLAKNPGSVRAHNNASLNFMNRKEWDKAAAVLDSCLRLEPRYAYCLINRAMVGVSRGEERLAEEHFKRAIEADFAGVHGRRYYAEFLFTRGRLTEALAYAQQAEEAAKGQNLFVRLLLIRLHLNIGEKAKASEIWQASFESFGADPVLMSLEAQVRGH